MKKLIIFVVMVVSLTAGCSSVDFLEYRLEKMNWALNKARDHLDQAEESFQEQKATLAETQKAYQVYLEVQAEVEQAYLESFAPAAARWLLDGHRRLADAYQESIQRQQVLLEDSELMIESARQRIKILAEGLEEIERRRE